jgi:hypothetical protein
MEKQPFTFTLTIYSAKSITDATKLCEGEITLTSERQGSPAKLTFNVLRIFGLSFFEGDAVSLTVNSVQMFKGYVFKKSRDKEPIISVTCYDQIRYLKNKETYVYTNKTAAEVLQMVAADFDLLVGYVADTGYVIPSRAEDLQTLMDVIYTALDLTLVNTGQLYVLYDDFGALTIRNIREMLIPIVLSSRAGMIDYAYTTDIDTETYNKVKLVRDNKDSKTREAYITQDSGNIAKWGILQHTEKVDENLTEGQIKEMADQILKDKNKVHKTLSIEQLASGANSELRIRAGCSLFVEIPNLAEISLNQLLTVEKCVHTFSNNQHSIKLDFTGDIPE